MSDSIKPGFVNELIRSRRSIYPVQYTGEQVDNMIIEQMLENANWAPSHRQTEPWRFVVYSGDGLKKLAEQQAALYKKVTEADGTFKEDRYMNLLSKPLEASHVIVIGIVRDPAGVVPEIEELGAAYCAVQNMYLTAAVYGIGCYLGSGGITYFQEAGSLFGFDRMIGYLYVGIPKNELSLKGRRKPVSEKTKWIR